MAMELESQAAWIRGSFTSEGFSERPLEKQKERMDGWADLAERMAIWVRRECFVEGFVVVRSL